MPPLCMRARHDKRLPFERRARARAPRADSHRDECAGGRAQPSPLPPFDRRPPSCGRRARARRADSNSELEGTVDATRVGNVARCARARATLGRCFGGWRSSARSLALLPRFSPEQREGEERVGDSCKNREGCVHDPNPALPSPPLRHWQLHQPLLLRHQPRRPRLSRLLLLPPQARPPSRRRGMLPMYTC